MYVCIYIYIYTRTYIYTHTYVVCMYTYVQDTKLTAGSNEKRAREVDKGVFFEKLVVHHVQEESKECLQPGEAIEEKLRFWK